MNGKHEVTGVFCAAATPLKENGDPELQLFADHCRRLIDDGCHGIALLGTTGEANSFSKDERRSILESAVAAGIAPERLMPGTGVAAIPETIALTKHALSLGVTRVVMLPPFYYKGVSDEALYATYSQILEKINDDRLKVILYHIPQVSGIALSIPLVKRLAASFPDTIVGIKDSAGDFANMQALIAEVPNFCRSSRQAVRVASPRRPISSATPCDSSSITSRIRQRRRASKRPRRASMLIGRFRTPMSRSRRSRRCLR
jgi:4-hydroxy-tetrahydrodipicolinate synthase